VAVSTETLRVELLGLRDRLKAELAEVESQIGGLLKLKSDLTNRLAAAEQVLAAEFPESDPGVTRPTRSAERLVRLNKRGPVTCSYDVLKAAGHPMHVKAILAELYAMGFRSNARRPDAMLSGTLRQSSRFRPCGHDTWALAEWPEEVCKSKAEA